VFSKIVRRLVKAGLTGCLAVKRPNLTQLTRRMIYTG